MTHHPPAAVATSLLDMKPLPPPLSNVPPPPPLSFKKKRTVLTENLIQKNYERYNSFSIHVQNMENNVKLYDIITYEILDCNFETQKNCHHSLSA
ncbi:hypothetical protein VIGAN_UM132600 [Vigna angularis var. angularis]|uniref:Uncharacterized protein n=1 Tax=Vigna angularis var. angularis TaxID=157739 RepID=A0A0S3TEN7_PHAAN|nr:hypothetical protein VIGAN_UM132600 [Vigna angularis var. angularis]